MGETRWEFGDYEHTPWGGVQEIVSRKGDVVARIDCDEGDMKVAHLVVAAPEMLAACEEAYHVILSAVSEACDLPDFDPAEHTTAKRLAAAIAKAKGGA